jgi:hypothetical protein
MRPQRPASGRAQGTNVERRHQAAAAPQFSPVKGGLARGHDQLQAIASGTADQTVVWSKWPWLQMMVSMPDGLTSRRRMF